MVRNSRSDDLFLAVIYAFLFLSLVLVLYPLLFVLSASISDPAAVNSGRMLLIPMDITMEGYQRLFKSADIWIGYRNSVLYTIAGTLITLFTTCTAAYALSRREMAGRTFFTLFFTFTMFFGGGIIPTYLLVKNMGLLDTPWVILIFGAASMWNIVLVRTYFQSSIPMEMQEAAFIDGANHVTLFARIIIPLSGPIIAVIALYSAVGRWNEYFSSMIYLKSRGLYPLQLFLREILITNQISAASLKDAQGNMISMAEQAKIAEVMKYAVIIVASAPMLIAYPFVQRFFVKGIMVGSIKG